MDTTLYRHDLELIRQTAEQTIRDFELVGIDIHFSGNEETAYEELKNQITPALKKFIGEQNSRFWTLLYRVDIPEEHLNRLLKQQSIADFPEKLAALILEREFLKAVTRRYFSNH